MNRFDSDYAYSNYTRYMKKCGSWMACAAKGEKGVFNFDYWIDRKAIDDREDWNGRLLEDGNIKVEKESALVCLDGNPVVNGITLNRYDYDDLTIDKLYDININDGVLALFTRR